MHKLMNLIQVLLQQHLGKKDNHIKRDKIFRIIHNLY
jgi:hypothetical protein